MVVRFKFVEGGALAPKSYRLGDLRWAPGEEVDVSNAAHIAALRGLPFMLATELQPDKPASATTAKPSGPAYDDPDLNAALGGPVPGLDDDEQATTADDPETGAVEAAGRLAGQPAAPAAPVAKPAKAGKHVGKAAAQ